MTEVKLKRIIHAVVSGAVMLTFILLAILTYQLLAMNTSKKKIDALDEEISALSMQIENTENEIEKWSMEWKIKERARELGLYEPEDD